MVEGGFLYFICRRENGISIEPERDKYGIRYYEPKHCPECGIKLKGKKDGSH